MEKKNDIRVVEIALIDKVLYYVDSARGSRLRLVVPKTVELGRRLTLDSMAVTLLLKVCTRN